MIFTSCSSTYSFNFSSAVLTELASKIFLLFFKLFTYLILNKIFFFEKPIACNNTKMGIFFLLSILANNSLYFRSLTLNLLFLIKISLILLKIIILYLEKVCETYVYFYC